MGVVLAHCEADSQRLSSPAEQIDLYRALPVVSAHDFRALPASVSTAAGHLSFSLASAASLALGLAFIALLYVLLNRLTGHVKFLPIFFLLMLLYAIGKLSHLSPLVLVLAFGLLLNNAFLLRRIEWLRQHESESFEASYNFV